MVEIHHHHVVANVEHTSHEAIALLVLQGHDSINAHMLMIELSVDAEHLLLQFHDALLVELAIGLVGRQREVEAGTGLELLELLLECLDGDSKPADEGKRLVGRHPFNQVTARIVGGKQVVCNGDELVLLLFHIYIK